MEQGDKTRAGNCGAADSRAEPHASGAGQITSGYLLLSGVERSDKTQDTLIPTSSRRAIRWREYPD